MKKIYTFKIAFIRKDGIVCNVWRNTTVEEVQKYAQRVMRDNPGKFFSYEIGNYTVKEVAS